MDLSRLSPGSPGGKIYAADAKLSPRLYDRLTHRRELPNVKKIDNLTFTAAP